jgi:hypothetical protein
MPSDWLASRLVVVLRLRSADVPPATRLKVPDVFDGFDGEIFDPTEDDLTPKTGVTIDITDPDNPRPGWPEVVLGPLEIALIEAWPAIIDDDDYDRRPVFLGPRLWTGLRNYYQAGIVPAPGSM